MTAPKDAIEMRFWQIEAVKERMAPQQILYIEALGKSLLAIDLPHQNKPL